MPEEHLLGSDWENKFVPNVIGGIVLNKHPESMDSSQFLQLHNIRYVDDVLTRDTGYKSFANTTFGNGRISFQHITAGGVANTFLITDLTLCRKSGNFWHLVPIQAITTIDGNVSGTNTVIPVTSTTGISANNTVAIELDDGSHHISTVVSVSAGISVTISDPVPGSGVVATSGNDFILGITLAGNSDNYVDALSVPWNDWLVFTNGIDIVKYYDPATTFVQNIPGLPSSGNVICKSLALFDSSIILVSTTEGGANFNQRLRWSDRGDGTEWVSGEAGFIDLFDSAHKLQKALPIGPYLAVYRENSIVRGSAINSATKRFDWLPVIPGAGLMAPGAVADIGIQHIVVGLDDIYLYKGGFDIQPISAPVDKILYGIESELDLSKIHKTLCIFEEERSEVFIFFQSVAAVAELDKILRLDVDFGVFLTRTLANEITGYGYSVQSNSFTWNDLVGSWSEQTWSWNSSAVVSISNTLLFCASNSLVYEYDFLTPFDAFISGVSQVAISFIVETPDFAHPNGFLRHDYLEVMCSGGETTVEYSTDSGNSWMVLETFDPGAILRKVRLYKQFVGRSIRYRITGSLDFSLAWYNIRATLETEN